MTTFNPWPSNPPTRGSTSQRRITRLVGKEQGKVFVLVKFHNWSGRAIYLYNLLTKDEYFHIPRPTQEEWDQYMNAPGVNIPRPPSMEATNAEGWIKFGKQEAARLGLTVAE
jgi:hypothetical protein